MDTLRIALIQSCSTVGSETLDPRADNLERALRAIRDAAAEGARMVVFGEMYLSGYRTDEWLYKWATQLDPPDEHVQALEEAARADNVHILMGVATHGQHMPGDIYNSTLLVAPEGLLGVYRKTHVCAFPHSLGVSTERCFYSPGKEIPVFDTALGRLGIHICYDIAFPEVSRVQALKGAQILINTSASAAGFEEFWDHALYTRAVENGIWYVVCSVVGEQRGDVLFGGSRVIAPDGRVIAAAPYLEEKVILADIDLGLSRRSRATFHTFSTRQPELYGPITQPTPYP